MKARDYQQEAIDKSWEIFKTKRSALILLATGLGKCFAKDTPIMLYDGNIISVQDVKVGYQLMGPDSEPRTVESLAHGYEEMYEIKPVKGMPYIVNESHILSLKITGMSRDGLKTVRDSKGNKYKAGDIVNVDIKTYLASNDEFKHCAKGYRVPVNFSNGYKELPIDPYVLGIWLGDGSSRTTDITTMDKEVIDSLSEYCISNSLRLRKRNQCGKAWTYSITCDDRRHGKNILRKGLKELNLLQNKHIPHIYKTASISTRYELLAGILDSDGFYCGKCYDYVSVRKQFAEDIAFIARSLGLAAYIKPCKKTCTNNGVTNDYYRICISGDLSLIPCRVERRKASERKQIKNVLLTGIKVTPVGVGEYFGFTLSGNDRRFLLGDFTVAHNTITFAHAAERMWREKRKRILVIAHREELIRQAADKIERATELHCEIEMAAEYATTNTMFDLPEVVVATVQTLSQDYRLKRFDPKDFSLIVVDECFPAGTKVDGKNIEEYKIGDSVSSYNHATETIENKKVLHVFKNEQKDSLVQLNFSNGKSFVCTKNHPIFDLNRGYIPAILTQNSMVLDIEHNQGHTKNAEELHKAKTMRGLRRDIFAEKLEQYNDTNMLREMQSSEERGKKKVLRCALQNMWESFAYYRRGEQGEIRKRVFNMLQEVSRSNGSQIFSRYKQEICFRKNEKKQSNEEERGKGKGINQAEGYGMDAKNKRREWLWAYSCSVFACVRSWMGYGSSGSNKDEKGFRLSNMLQTGHSEHGPKNRNRGGWQQSLCDRAASSGHEERKAIEAIRVESVEILESRDYGQSAGVREKSFVYNIEVEGNNNYFVEGILVHNCHRTVGASYRKVIDYFFAGNPDIKLSGVTATADRSDEQALGQVFDDVAKEYDILDGINDGWLVPLEQAVVEVGSMDLSQCKIQLGDFASNDLNGILEQEKVLQEMALPFMQIAKGRKTLVFTSSVEQSKLMCDVFNRKGFEPGSTEHIDGTTAKDIRRNIIERYYRSELTRLCNCGIFTEGFDDPGVHVIANGRPTKSRMLYTQICGRATRPAEEIASLLNDCKDADERKAMIAASSKPSALIIDPVGNSGRHKLITVADVLGGKYPDEVVELAVANAKRKGKPENVMTELARAEAEIAERHRKAELAKAREQIKFNGKFFVRNVSPFDALAISPKRIPGYVKTNPMTSKQRDMLERWGIPNVDQIQNTLHASQIIEAAPPSSAQLYRLRQAGLPIDKINRLKANKIITILAKNNWQLTAGNREYIMKEIINKK